ncbi:PAS domain-containing protein [Spirochaetota bacterium]
MDNKNKTKSELLKQLQSTQKKLDELTHRLNEAQNQIDHWKNTENERKLAEKALIESEDRFRNVINNVLEYIYSTEYIYGDLTSTFHSPRCRDITGYTSEEYMENPDLWMQNVYDDDKELVYNFYKNLDQNMKPAIIEHRIIHRNGDIKWVSNTCSIQAVRENLMFIEKAIPHAMDLLMDNVSDCGSI